ncbi:MAG: hypothetical protein JSR45_18345 [Proteobacteria bacterium]|nr:hypothetical protein [Pseudomonadota bacterium]
MNATVLGLLLLGVFGGVPQDAHKQLAVFNDTKAPVDLQVEGLGHVSLAAGGSAVIPVPEYGAHTFSAQVGSRNFASTYNLGAAEGLFQPPAQVSWCVAVQRIGVILLARQECLHRLKKLP